MGLLTDIYNTVARFFRAQDEQVGNNASKSVAQNRLKLVLMQDRTNLTPKVLEQMRGEMIDLLSKYLEMDKDLLELNFEQEGDQVALMLSIPVIRAKEEDEIEKACSSSETENEEDNDKSVDEEKDSAEISSDSQEEEEEEENEDEKPKPKKRRSKKVSVPQELDSEEQPSENNEEFEHKEQDIPCENLEG